MFATVRIALIAPVLSARDAVGSDMIEMAAVLRETGHVVRIYAEHASDIAETVYPTSSLVSWLADQHDIAIYHCSIGWPRACDLLRRLRCRRFVRYHNITPPNFFYGWSRDHVRACAAGRAMLPQLVALAPERWLACSSYNRDELVAFGADPAHIGVLAPFNRIEHLLDTPPDFDLLDRHGGAESHWLTVGRLAPNKDHATVLDAFAIYRREYEANARLLIVGKHDRRLATYTRSLRERVAKLGLGASVHFLDDVSEAALKACYLIADALVLPSRHEGFCVPLAEAMALSVPVVARAAAAIPSTLGDVGLLWADDDPRLYAASVARLRHDSTAREHLVAAGRMRWRKHYSRSVLARTLHEAIAP